MATKEQYEFFEAVYDEHRDRIQALESRAQLAIISRKDAKAQREEGISRKKVQNGRTADEHGFTRLGRPRKRGSAPRVPRLHALSPFTFHLSPHLAPSAYICVHPRLKFS